MGRCGKAVGYLLLCLAMGIKIVLIATATKDVSTVPNTVGHLCHSYTHDLCTPRGPLSPACLANGGTVFLNAGDLALISRLLTTEQYCFS